MPEDPDGLSIFTLLLMFACLALSALYAAGESAVNSLSASQVKRDAEAGDKKAKSLAKTIQAQVSVVSPLQSGLFFCGLLGLSFCVAAFYGPLYSAFYALEGHLRSVLAGLLPAAAYILVFFMFADLLPKKAARHSAERFAYRHAKLIRRMSKSAMPFLWFTSGVANCCLRLFRIDPHSLDDAVTEAEILQMVGEGEERGVIEETEKDMIANILDFNDTAAGEIMTHRTDVAAVPDDASISQVVAVAIEHGCSRVPVYHEDIDSVVGVCYVKDLLPYVGIQVPEAASVVQLMRPAYFIPETKKCSQLFTEMTERKVQIAIVVDEYGGTAGIITLEDLVESIVGNIQDEYDHEEEEIRQVSETEFTVDGTASIDEISDLTGVELPEGNYDTIAGLVTEILGYIPKQGEHPQVRAEGLSITVLEIDDQRLSRLLIVKEPPVVEEEDED
ncbi:HlyC/CorC family transporter [Acutalibacter sp. 1XD8-33]|uniref:hemolysin family protein n=1 Tax=Acutalibacter sp. 1XD8-33 TaxID=2320081 RepID=UPI000EA1C21D|nr:hemolysin family protein [Acutalibacter sp. 1XD8-33]RKJ39862.1 HlyC/CorC family transporter [Acutalibacter sp. 1XD8-33]